VKPIIELKNITKTFPGVTALSEVNFDIMPGEVHVIIGENGAGKSTLGNIILGAQQPDTGEILLNSQPVSFRNPADALRQGIGGVNQEFMLVPWLSAAQNVFLNREHKSQRVPFLIDKKSMYNQASAIFKSLGLEIHPSTVVKRLTAAQKQMVEIAKVLVEKPSVVILDEPTAILSEGEVNLLFQKVRQLKESGTAVIYISHRLQEIREIGDRVTVLRDGKNIDTIKIVDVTDAELVRMMVGRTIDKMYPRHRREPGREVLRLVNCSVPNGPRNVNLTLYEGEIVGLAGLVGAGRTELARAIFGIDRFDSGEVYLYGESWPLKTLPSRMIKAGIGFVPEDRKELGLALRLTVAFNIVIASLKRLFRFIYRPGEARTVVKKHIENLRIVTPSVEQLVYQLSGGNQQKVVVAKWLETKSRIMIFDEPTRGIDVGAKTEIHSLMDQLVKEGAAILMISSDLPEILGMCDRVYVMYHGEMVGEIPYAKIDQNYVAALMLGTEKGV